MTFVRVWRFRPAAGREREFERAYGPDGDWAALFRRDPEFRGTALLRSASGVGDYLTVDRWSSRAAWESFRSVHAARYEALDEVMSALAMSEEELGEYLEL